MISVCIPIYNFDVRELIRELHQQLIDSAQPFEFIVMDDASEENFKILNKEISELPHLTYIELEENIGRSKIRNFLADEAQYEYLLFMDCDSQVSRPDYIQKYLENCQGEVIVCGGREYVPERPKNNKLALRWIYGQQREAIPAKVRQKNGNHSFMSNNFLISKTIFKRVKFDEAIVKYGHEDTLFGYELHILGISIIHIDNPLTHLGLEENSIFLEKTKHGVGNLLEIVERYPYDMLWYDIKLLNAYRKILKLKMRWAFKIFYFLFKGLLISNLLGSRPNLRYFDLYKLCYLCTLRKFIPQNKIATRY